MCFLYIQPREARPTQNMVLPRTNQERLEFFLSHPELQAHTALSLGLPPEIGYLQRQELRRALRSKYRRIYHINF